MDEITIRAYNQTHASAVPTRRNQGQGGTKAVAVVQAAAESTLGGADLLTRAHGLGLRQSALARQLYAGPDHGEGNEQRIRGMAHGYDLLLGIRDIRSARGSCRAFLAGERRYADTGSVARRRPGRYLG
jgi:hypothetical protein